MNNQPLISVIIPAYNAIETIAVALDSVRAQTYRHYEIIVVDDGSNDGTTEFLAQQPDIQHIIQTNQGLAITRNRGAAAAKGEYLAFLDSDDLWHPQKLEIQVKIAAEIGDFGILGTKVLSYQDLSRKPDFHGNANKKPLLRRYDFYDILQSARCLPSTVLIPALVFHRVDGFRPEFDYSEDRECWLRIVYRYPFYVVQEPLAGYYIRPGSLSRRGRWYGLIRIPLIIEEWNPSSPDTLDRERRIVGPRYRRIARRIIYRHGREILKYYDDQLFLKYWDRFKYCFGRLAPLVYRAVLLRNFIRYSFRHIQKKDVTPEMTKLLEGRPVK